MPKITYGELAKSWGIDPEANREIFEWLKADPRDEQGRLTREVGIRRPGGPVEKLERCHDEAGVLFYSLADGTLFPRGTGAQVSAMDVDLDIVYKTKEEMAKMTLAEIAEYVKTLGNNETLRYMEWIEGDLLDILEERGIGDDEFSRMVGWK
jgi:hypothetical protein